MKKKPGQIKKKRLNDFRFACLILLLSLIIFFSTRNPGTEITGSQHHLYTDSTWARSPGVNLVVNDSGNNVIVIR